MAYDKENYINSLNLNANTDFPYLVLNVENDNSYPLNLGFRVMHWHEDLQFIYCTSGMVRVKTLEDEKIISAGEGIFINKNVVHLVEKAGACKYKSFLFPDYFVSFYMGSPAARLTQKITENRAVSVIVLYDKNQWSNKALEILKELILLERDKNGLYCYEVLLRLSALWLIMLQNVHMSDELPDNTISTRMMKFLQYIELHYSEEITLEDLAKSANVSKSECLRCFKATLQTTPYKYLMDYRLSRAERLLKETDLPISRISAMTGFNQQSYFGKCFKEKMKCSPSKYRTKYKI
ncbi:MAG: AraC family transcriptional regulator [Clostridia bacterium]|nr:AraC family transcriptional regulator [Clostridia bacterium]